MSAIRGTPSPFSAEREALAFLDRDLAGPLGEPGRRRLARAVRSATAAGSLAPLRALAERERRELLELFEARLGKDRPSPRAVVRLASALSGLPPSEDGAALACAVPAR